MKVGQDKLYKAFGMWWSVKNFLDIGPNDVDGPYCSNCYADLEYPNSAYELISEYNYQIKKGWKGNLECENCGKKHPVEGGPWEMQRVVAVKYVANKRSLIPKESLDELPTAVKVRDQDEKYFIAAKIGEKDGKKVGVVYFGNKNKDQNKEDYSQVFIDLDDEQVRFDKSNMSPKNLIAKMRVDFPDASHEETYIRGSAKKAGKTKTSSKMG